MAQKETAEQKLLKIIEASKKAQAGSRSEAPAMLAKSAVTSPRRSFAFNVRQFNVFLIVCVVASALFFAYEVRSGLTLIGEEVVFSSGNGAARENVNLFVPQMKSVGYYLDRISSRNIFQPYEKKVEVKETAPSDLVALEKKMSKFKIVGIAWLDVPESATVMLEDTATHMTHFLKQGDKVEDVIVKIIYTDRVVFSRANEEITIKL
ncbi:MAG: hypothetical protein HQL20_01525 [Candidatus Omnitrophica bacterium]|nr:hypothetical protein [Candidatus Omnitrophota bacterium]